MGFQIERAHWGPNTVNWNRRDQTKAHYHKSQNPSERKSGLHIQDLESVISNSNTRSDSFRILQENDFERKIWSQHQPNVKIDSGSFQKCRISENVFPWTLSYKKANRRYGLIKTEIRWHRKEEICFVIVCGSFLCNVDCFFLEGSGNRILWNAGTWS